MTEKQEPRELTPHLVRILTFISHGYSNEQIGAALNVSVDTVKTHVGRILRRLRACDRAHAVRIGFEDGWLKGGGHRRERVVRQQGGRRRAS